MYIVMISSEGERTTVRYLCKLNHSSLSTICIASNKSGITTSLRKLAIADGALRFSLRFQFHYGWHHLQILQVLKHFAVAHQT